MELQVRWYSGTGYYHDNHERDGYRFGPLSISAATTAFLLVDCDSATNLRFLEEYIVPALRSARSMGFHIVYVHNDFALVDEPGSIRREIHGTRWGLVDAATRPAGKRSPCVPQYHPSIIPLKDEPDIPKNEWSGFTNTHLDYHLRCYKIDTIVAVGFSLRACLYQTLTGAVERNYRVILLRDCSYAAEYPDTVDATIPEGGWLRKIMLRNIEHTIGYTSTSAEFVSACSSSALSPSRLGRTEPQTGFGSDDHAS